MLVIFGVAVIVMLIAVIAGEPDGRRSGPPLDPRSTVGSGARAAVILLEQQGHSISIGGVDAGHSTYLLLDDNLQESDLERLLARVESGADLVIADGRSDIAPKVRSASTLGEHVDCDLPELALVDQIEVGVVPALAPGDIANCFPVSSGWFISVSSRGEGRVILMASSRPFTNSRIDEGHNAALVVGVMAMTEGEIRIVQALAGGGDTSLAELIGEPVWAALALVMLAFIAYGGFRARRLGMPVIESDPVEIAGSELVNATARLYGKAGENGHVVEAMRTQLRRDLGTRWAIGDDESIDVIVNRLQLHGEDEDQFRAALTAPVPRDEAGFTKLVGSCVRARHVIRGTHE